MDIQIRIEDPAQPDIVKLLQDGEAYSASLYPPENNHHMMLDALRQPSVRFLAARADDGRIVGTGAIAISADSAEIKRIWVVPEARGRGISRRILERLETLAREGGVREIVLETGIYNHAAHSLYERTGFVRCGAFGHYKADPLSVFMRKYL